MLLWIGEAYESESDLQRAAEYYLRSAVYHSRGYDVWGQSARFRAAEAMAKAGLVEDARRIYFSLMEVSEDAQRKAILERRVQQLWIADAVAKNAVSKKAPIPKTSPQKPTDKSVLKSKKIKQSVVKKEENQSVVKPKKKNQAVVKKEKNQPVVKLKAKKVKIKSTYKFDEDDEEFYSN